MLVWYIFPSYFRHRVFTYTHQLLQISFDMQINKPYETTRAGDDVHRIGLRAIKEADGVAGQYLTLE